MTDVHEDAPPGLLAGRYQLSTVLGRGGMATVWSAYDNRLGRTVAVKVLHDDRSTEHAQRIEREARAAARIADQRVVTVLDLDHTDDGHPFLVFEALSGRTLADEIRDEGPLGSERVQQLADDLLGGLAAAHVCGVLHRDIKPSNVLVDGDGFRITDFGIASVEDETATQGDLIGTLGYLAPERFDGEPASPSSDVFSASAVLYEAVTGIQPFRASTATEALARLRSGRFEALPTTVAEPLRGRITLGLDPDPSRRPVAAPGARDQAQAPTDTDEAARHVGTDSVGTRVVDAGHADATQRLDATAPLAPPAPPASEKLAAIQANESVRRVARSARRPQSLFIALGVVLLVLLAFVITRDSGDGTAPDPADDPAVRLDQQLDRLEELG